MDIHAGEPLDNIIRRKTLECEAADTVWWGVGENKGPAVFIHLANCEPEVLFSKMRGKAGLKDRKPGCFVWTTYRVYDPNEGGYGGKPLPVPKNVIVYSGPVKNCIYYAIVCSSLRQCGQSDVNSLYVANMTNLNNDGNAGETPGPRQTTCVVKYSRRAEAIGVPYPVEMRAKLAHPCFVELSAPIPLSDPQIQLLKKIGNKCRTVDDYRDVARKIRM